MEEFSILHLNYNKGIITMKLNSSEINSIGKTVTILKCKLKELKADTRVIEQGLTVEQVEDTIECLRHFLPGNY